MWYPMVMLIPVLLPTLVIKTISCSNDTNSDVFVRYSAHADVNQYSPEPRVVPMSAPVVVTTVKAVTLAPVITNPPTIYYQPVTTKQTTTTQQPIEEETEGVVFIPNVAPVARVEDEIAEKRGYKLQDLLEKREFNDLMEKQYRLATEPPEDIVFLADKNHDIIENRSREEKEHRKKKNRQEVEEDMPNYILDCHNLDCNNTIKSVCGSKFLNKALQYRLFLNDCYFRKVNCNFKYQINRYKQVAIENCKKIGAHLVERPYSFKPKYVEEPKEKVKLGARRSFSSRRSMGMNMNGQFCSHACPISCPDDYEPECAVSATGQKKVFMNHCKLDDNSCLFGVVWHKRPLSECVGGKKADMRQNRFFIGWMQRVGILDNKGKLVLE